MNDVLVILTSQMLQRCMISPHIGLRRLRPRSGRSQFQDMTFVHVISYTLYGTVSYRLCVEILKIYVEVLRYALKVVVTCEESWEAMAEWVMIDAAFSDVGGIPGTIFFRFQHLMCLFGEKYRFQMATWTIEAFPGRQKWGERTQTFPPLLEKKHVHFYWMDFFET